MADRIIWGAVNADGSIKSGSGFDCTRIAQGTYLLDYDTPFTDMPAVVLTQNYPTWDAFNTPGGNTLDNAVLIASDRNKAKLQTGSSVGDRQDRNFTFLVVGPG